MEEPTTETPPSTTTDTYQESDVFAWANNLVPLLEGLSVELFLVNKNYVLYRTSMSKELGKQLQPLFIDNLLEHILEGVDRGLVVRNFEDGEAEEGVLQRTRVKNVENARTTLNWLKMQEHEIETFVEEEHDFKRIKGVLARCTHPELPAPFYVIKHLPGSTMIKGKQAWLMRGGKFVPFDAEGSLRVPADNQLLILDQDLYVFNQSKLTQMFGYDAKKYRIAMDKIRQINENYTFSFADDQTWEKMLQDKKVLVNKLQKLDPELVKREDLLRHAEELGIEVMTDDKGAIIIMDDKDMAKFITLLNDDYIESPLTGIRYEIKSKRPLKITEEAFGQEIV